MDLFGDAAMLNAYCICHNIQVRRNSEGDGTNRILVLRTFYFTEGTGFLEHRKNQRRKREARDDEKTTYFVY